MPTHIGREPVDDEPDERPDRLGRELIEIRDDPELHGKWWDVLTASRSTVLQGIRRLTGKTVPAGVPGLRDVEGWEARLAERTEDSGTVYKLRVRYTPPKQPALLDDKRADEAFGKLRDQQRPADPLEGFAPPEALS